MPHRHQGGGVLYTDNHIPFMPSDRQGGVADAAGDPDYYTVFGVHGGSEVAGGPGSSPS